MYAGTLATYYSRPYLLDGMGPYSMEMRDATTL